MKITDVLKLDRPLIFFDVETHDFVPADQARIVEFALIKIATDGSIIRQWSSLINPGAPISPQAEAKHGIRNEDVVGKPPFFQLAESLALGFRDSDIGGYNVKTFDVEVFSAELRRSRVDPSFLQEARIIDGFRLWQVFQPRSLTDACKVFLNRDPSGAHRASSDTQDALDVCTALITLMHDKPVPVQTVHDQCFRRDPNAIDADGKVYWFNNKPCLSFGKWKDVSLYEVDPSYLSWMITRGNFSSEVRKIVTDVIEGRFPKTRTEVK